MGALPGDAMAALRTFYVSPTGSDSAAGTSSAPWRTLQHAANTVRAGDLVVVRAGRYAGFDLRVSGTAANPIEFRAEPGAIVDTRNPITPDGINLEGASWILVEGFTVVGMPRAGIRAVLNHHVTIRGNTMDGNGSWGVLSGFSDDLLIEDNEASRSQVEHGIYVSNSGDRPTIRRNHVWGNRANGIHMNGDASLGGDGIISGALVERNVIHDNGTAGGSAINADGVQDSRFQNNLIYGNHAGGISLYRIDGGGGSSRNLVAHNTIVQAADARWALNITGGSTSNTIYNNILYTAHSFRGSVTVSPDSRSGLTSDWNVVMNRFSIDDGSSRISLAQWQATTGQDVHSVIAAPAALFLDPAANDYHLKPGAPGLDAGTTLAGVTEDIDGVVRPSGAGVDIGAYEAAAAAFAVSIGIQGSAVGTVTSQPAGITCRPACTAAFGAGTTVVLTAAAPAGGTFSRWGGACAGTSPQCAVTISDALAVTATFAAVFTDAALVQGSTVIRAAHLTELRGAVDTLRAARGLMPVGWGEPIAAGVTIVRATHLVELRGAIDDVYRGDGLAVPAWGPAPVETVTPIAAAHIEELRAAIRALE